MVIIGLAFVLVAWYLMRLKPRDAVETLVAVVLIASIAINGRSIGRATRRRIRAVLGNDDSTNGGP
jgi:hypothetical protein